MKTLLPKSSINSELKKIMLEHFENNYFFTLFNKSYVLGANGEAVKHNLNREWKLANFVQDDAPVFYYQNSGDLKGYFEQLLRVVGKLPFSFVSETSPPKEHQEHEDLSDFFKDTAFSQLTKWTFCVPDEATSCFHQIQKERKMWWRKFSSLPGRFIETEIKTDNEEKYQKGEIRAEFIWGDECVEQIKFFDKTSLLELKDGRRTITPSIIISEMKLELATFVYLCDAFDPINEETCRKSMRFHRKLAPFQVTFAATGSTSQTTKDLQDLALLLARRLRKVQIPCLTVHDLGKKSLEKQFLQADAFGIPYTIVLNERTLKDGILGLRNRDTTLQEQSHVTLVVPYVEKIMKNY